MRRPLVGPSARRWLALIVWASAIGLFWSSARSSDQGALRFVASLLEGAVDTPWAPLVVLSGYLLRPVALIPITVLNVSAGFVVGVPWAFVVAALGTLASATVGYAIGTTMPADASASAPRVVRRFVDVVRRRSFESVVAGGLMYLHADAVNFPAGALRIRFPIFLAGIAVGNALTMSSAVLAGASLEGSLTEARWTLDTSLVWIAALLLAFSIVLATWLRRRTTAKVEADTQASPDVNARTPQ